MKCPIDRKEKVLLGGLKQIIHIWGTKQENPVVLFLHSGPGVPNRHGMAKNHMDLIDDFTIVAWDQRGTGGSYFGCDPELGTLVCRKHPERSPVISATGRWSTALRTRTCPTPLQF